MDELMSYQCIDFRKLLVLKSKQLKLSDDECHILLIIMTLDDIGIKGINPMVIKEYSSHSSSRIDEIMVSLVDKKLIKRNKGTLELKPLYALLLNSETKEETKDIDLVSLFENAFGRCFSQVEINILNNFKASGYDDEMIADALNESVKAGVFNFRYIEKILLNWSKYGKKQKYAPMREEKEDQFSKEVKEFKWW